MENKSFIKDIEVKPENIQKLLESLIPGVEIDRNFLLLFMTTYKEGKEIKPKVSFDSKVNLTIEQTRYFGIKETTVGKLIFNAFCLPSVYLKEYGFISDTITASVYGQLHDNLALMLSTGRISSSLYAEIIDRISWLGMQMTNFRGKCMDFDSINMSEKFLSYKNQRYAELIKKGAEGNEVTKVEDELIQMAKAEKRDSGLVHIISSGAKGSFGNNFKVLNVGRGIVKTGSGELMTMNKSLSEGNGPAEYVNTSNNSILGSFGRSLKTAQGGYLFKLVSQNFSHLQINKSIDDCKTPNYLRVKLTKANYKDYLYRNIKIFGTHDQYESLSLENLSKYINNDVQIRSPLFCHAETGVCPMCYGDLYKVNKIDSGLSVVISDLASTIMNKNMKSFHDLTIKYQKIDIDKYF